MANQEKTYIKGSAKSFTFDNGGTIIRLGLNADQIKELANDKGWVNVVVKEKREVDEYGNTHYMELDTWKPSEDAKSSKTAKPKASKKVDDDLPF